MANSKELDELLKALDESQQELFRKLTAARAAAAIPRASARAKLSAADLQKLKIEAEAYKATQRNAGVAMSQLVTGQLDAALRTGDVEEIRRAILEQHGAWDDCNCTSGSALRK